jgi:phosphate transport system substrate-binding protein
VTRFAAGTVDFGASDVPMNEYQLGQTVLKRGAVVQFPVALGGVAIIYNLPGFGQTLHLDGTALARIFMGEITAWDDPAIAALNPGARLPHEPITPVHRADGSGTTYITTDYLQAVSTAWYTRLGKGVRVAWPTGITGVGSPGLLRAVESHPYAIGYVEMSYALAAHVPVVALRNAAGTFVLPMQQSVAAAAAQFPTIDWRHFSIVNAPGTMSYPIAGYSWGLLRQHPKAHAVALVQLFKWLTTDGQQFAAQLQYVPLPAQARQLAADTLGTVS